MRGGPLLPFWVLLITPGQHVFRAGAEALKLLRYHSTVYNPLCMDLGNGYVASCASCTNQAELLAIKTAA